MSSLKNLNKENTNYYSTINNKFHQRNTSLGTEINQVLKLKKNYNTFQYLYFFNNV